MSSCAVDLFTCLWYHRPCSIFLVMRTLGQQPEKSASATLSLVVGWPVTCFTTTPAMSKPSLKSAAFSGDAYPGATTRKLASTINSCAVDLFTCPRYHHPYDSQTSFETGSIFLVMRTLGQQPEKSASAARSVVVDLANYLFYPPPLTIPRPGLESSASFWW